MSQDQSYGLVIDAMAAGLEKVQAIVMDAVDNFMNSFLGWLGGCVESGMNKCSELKSAVSNKLSDFRPSPSSSPSIEKVQSPSIERAPEISAPSFAPSHSIQNALSGMNFSFAAEDLGNASVGENGVGCASQTYSRYQTHSAAMVH